MMYHIVGWRTIGLVEYDGLVQCCHKDLSYGPHSMSFHRFPLRPPPTPRSVWLARASHAPTATATETTTCTSRSKSLRQ